MRILDLLGKIDVWCKRNLSGLSWALSFISLFIMIFTHDIEFGILAIIFRLIDLRNNKKLVCTMYRQIRCNKIAAWKLKSQCLLELETICLCFNGLAMFSSGIEAQNYQNTMKLIKRN